MPLRQQLLLGALLLLATGASIRNIAAARNEGAVGGRVYRLDESRGRETSAFTEILRMIEGLGRSELAAQLRERQRSGDIWVAPGLGAERWAIYVSTFGLVRRIYVRDVALLHPERHLFPEATDLTPERRQAFANVSLAGALYHELLHWDGELDEARTYDREIAWLESLRSSQPPDATSADRSVLDWGIESATLSAQKARALATGTP